MPAHKTHNSSDSGLDRQIEEIIHYLNQPECPELPVYANNTAALAGGLTKGRFYRTSTGTLMVVY